MRTADIDTHEGRRLAAIALVALGEDRAASVLSALGESEAAQIAVEVLRLGPVSAEEIAFALTELSSQLDTIHAATAPGEQFARSVLSRAFGPGPAGRILEDITRPDEFSWLSEADPDVASRVLASEPPATIALALAHLDPKAAAKLLTRLPSEIRTEVAVRIACLDAVDVETVSTVDSALRERVGVTLRAQVRRVAGTEVLAGMLSSAPRAAEETVVAYLQEKDPEMARKVRSAMFTFEDLPSLLARDLQKILSQVEVGDLAVAVSGSSPAAAEAVKSNLSERARDNLEEEISYLQGVRPSDVRTAQENIMEVVRRMEAEGEINLPRAGDEEDEQ